MTMKVLPKASLVGWAEDLRSRFRLVAPVAAGTTHRFEEIRDGAAVQLDYPTTILPPKKVVLPTVEAIVQFRGGAPAAPPAREPRPTVLLGVHSCDLHAFELLDRVYRTGFPDQAYLARREAVTLVGVECLRPCSQTSFCKSMGTLSPPAGLDLNLIDLGPDYAAEVGTLKGEALVEESPGFREADASDYRRLERVMGEKWGRFPYRLDFDVADLPGLLSGDSINGLWEELGERCLSCASCTMVCPTCTCFDVRDEAELNLTDGVRSRVWDSCQLAPFAVVAGGHNFRSSRAARVRHRFLRKGKYQREALGVVGCVGCGRCAQACPAGITPIETYNSIYTRRRLAGVKREEAAR
jgi:formate hydrogenlyase subunit 6/NADH:ubiquinone oxidoreductase subunit I